MSNINAIFDKFGSMAALARAIGKTPSSVQVWKDNGVIPWAHVPAIYDAAKRLGIQIDHRDFYEWPDTEPCARCPLTADQHPPATDAAVKGSRRRRARTTQPS